LAVIWGFKNHRIVSYTAVTCCDSFIYVMLRNEKFIQASFSARCLVCRWCSVRMWFVSLHVRFAGVSGMLACSSNVKRFVECSFLCLSSSYFDILLDNMRKSTKYYGRRTRLGFSGDWSLSLHVPECPSLFVTFSIKSRRLNWLVE
jgi:hypothetical protein